MASLWRGRVSLLGRVYALVTVLVVLLGVVAVGTVAFRQRAEAVTTHLTTVLLPAERSATALTAAYSRQARSVRGFQITGDPSVLSEYVAARAEAENLQADIGRRMSGYPSVMRALSGVRDAAGAWIPDPVDPIPGTGRGQRLLALSPADTVAMQDRFDALRAELATLQQRTDRIAVSETSEADAVRAAATWFAVGVVLIGLVIAAGAVLSLRLSLTRPLRTLLSQVNRVAEGELDHAVRLVGPPELTSVASAVETMRGRIVEETGRTARVQQDLARHEAAERRRAEQDYATVVAALDEGVIVVGTAGTIEAANPAAQRIFDADESTIVGSSTASWPLFDESGVELRPDNHLAMPTRQTGEPQNARVLRLERADGRDVWLSVTARALRPDDPPPHVVVTSFTDISESRAARQRLEYEATHDPLTGLANRTMVLRHCDERPRERSMALLYIDLDNFKRINDSLGHSAGDDVLRLIGERLMHATSSETLVSRLGGDEFVLLDHDENDPEALVELSQHLLDTLTQPILLENRQLHVGGSIGIAVSPPGDTRTGQDLLRDADVAMYEAKTEGTERYAFFDVELRDRVQRNMVLEQDLRHAVAEDQLWVAYQPVVDLRTEGTVAVEGLLRWTHPTNGTVPPDVFIPLAEETELINPIGAHMLRMATRQLAAERGRHDIDLRLNANLSPRQLGDPHLRSVVRNALVESDLPAGALCLEITENAIMHDPERAARVLHELRELGVYLAIDDFGTGYASLSQLRRLPLDTLKIDRSFVTDLGDSHDLRVIVTSIVAMSHAIGLDVVAEGVETSQQLELLRDFGCDHVQGFYLGKPVPVAELFAERGDR